MGSPTLRLLGALGVTVIAGGLLPSCGLRHVASPTVQEGLAHCAQASNANLQASYLGDFRQILSDSPKSPPIKGGVVHPSYSAYTDYVGGHLIGFVSNLAYTTPYWQENQAAARSLGYQLGSVPMVPLSGQIVIDHPGILEGYEFLTEYKSDSAAQQFEEMLLRGISPHTVADYVPLPAPIFGSTAVRYSVGSSSAPAGTEDEIRVEVLDHNFEADFAFRGGDAMNEKEVARIVNQTIGGLNRDCSLSTKSGR